MKESKVFGLSVVGIGCFALLMWVIYGAILLGLVYLAVKIAKSVWAS